MAEEAEYRQLRFVPRPGSCELLLVRHGESAAQRPGEPPPSFEGHDDPDLHGDGRWQADRVADRLDQEDITAIYVTPLRRTSQTAAPLAGRLGLEPRVEPDLREVHLGDWEGGNFRRNMAGDDPLAREVRASRRWDLIPGAEPGAAFATRVRRGIEAIAARHADETVAVFAHGGTIAQVLALAASSDDMWSFLSDNASISHIVVERDRWVLRRFNDTAHLSEHFSLRAQPIT